MGEDTSAPLEAFSSRVPREPARTSRSWSSSARRKGSAWHGRGRRCLPGWLLLPLAVALGCGGGGGADGDAGVELCTEDSFCDDGIFCNGVEACDPTSTAADARGCVPATETACASGEACDEVLETCMDSCVDADGDGTADAACGGSDCDDSDPERFPGNTEVCDAAAVDEDCDPSTFGDTNADGDGFISAECCNVDESGDRICGADCDDSAADVNPETSEVCDGVDNNCDGEVDDAAPVEWYPDADGDLFGDADAAPTVSCTPPDDFVTNARDCDDSRPSVNPGNPEVDGNGIDDNCNGRVDEGATQLFEGGITTLGGTATRTNARLSQGRIETFERVCQGTSCLTGGIVP